MAQERISCIYKINSYVHPDRFYIGSARNFFDRRLKHLSRLRRGLHNPILQAHYNKHGKVDLWFEVFVKCPESDLLKVEQSYIDTLKPYFNASPTASGTRGVKHSAEVCKRDSERNTGSKNPQFGTKHSKEHCANISKALKGKPKSEEHNRKNSESHLGQPAWNEGLTKETSEILKKTGEKISKMLTGRKHPPFSAEHRKHLSESGRGRICKRGKEHPMFGKHLKPESIEKMKATKKRNREAKNGGTAKI